MSETQETPSLSSVLFIPINQEYEPLFSEVDEKFQLLTCKVYRPGFLFWIKKLFRMI